MRRRDFVVRLGGVALAWPFVALAQRAGRIARVGFLGSETASEYAINVDALRAGLRDLGYVEGKDLVFEYRWAEGNNERLPSLAMELAGLKVDVLVTHGTPGTLAAKRATSTIPIVMATSGDAVGTGVIASLARPGGNITGLTLLLPELSVKRLDLLKEALPRTTRVAALVNPLNPALETDISKAEAAAKSMKIQLQRFGVRGPNDFESAFSAILKYRANAVLIHQDGMLNSNAGKIADIARKHKLPSVGFKELAEAGGLIGYGVSFPQMYRHAAAFVDKLLKGAKAGDLPVEQPSTFELVVNLRTAKTLGVTVPRTILTRADAVIE